MDGFVSDAAGLEFLLPDAPEFGAWLETAPGVLWTRSPLPISLGWINLYLLRDEGGWTLVDAGLDTPEARAAWEAVFAALDGPIVRVICTHMHPDHIGLAGWIAQRFDAPLWMTRLEYVTARMLVADTGRAAPEAGVAFYRRAGWDEAALGRYRARFGMFGRAVSPLPDSFHRLEDGAVLRIGGQPWRVLVGCGHSPEHACLLRESDGVFISGDQVLPRISSNVSVFPTEPEADPLADWLHSCARLIEQTPETARVMPAHNAPFSGLHLRLRQLITSHARALDRVERLLREEPRTALACFPALFGRAIGAGDLGLATGETLAHLNRLRAQGRVRRTPGADGVDRYAAG